MLLNGRGLGMSRGDAHRTNDKSPRGQDALAAPDATAPRPDSVAADLLIKDFLNGGTEATRVFTGWARGIASHRDWGFETIDDIVQSTLLAVVQNLRAGKYASGDLRAYVRRIAKNICISNYRKARTRGVSIPLGGTEQPQAKEPRWHSRLDKVLELLEAPCKEIMLLAYLEGYSRAEIGGKLGISAEAARVRLSRCIQKARVFAMRGPSTDFGGIDE